MKKILLYILLMPALLAGCSSDPDEIAQGDISVNETWLEFPNTGGTQVLKVTATNLSQWEAYSNISWIELGEPDFANGTIEVTVGPTEEIEDQQGRVVIHTARTEVINITVKQKGNGIIHDRNWLGRWGVNGPVKSMNCFFNPVFIWEADPGYMWELELNEAGNPTSYNFWKYLSRTDEGQPLYYLNNAEVTYDDRDRIKTVQVMTENILGDGNDHEFTVTFIYGNHGKYIETDHLFLYLTDMFYFDINHRMILPAMMKDLVRIDIWNTGIVPRELSMVFDIKGDTGSVTWTRIVENEYRETPVFDYTFNNGYSNLAYEGSFIGFPVPYQYNYDVDPYSGNILGVEYFFDEDFIIVEKKYHNNLTNSLYYYYDTLWYGYMMSVEHDENYNVTELNDPGLGVNARFQYGDYDDYGNWTRISDEYTSHEATFEIPEVREISYYE